MRVTVSIFLLWCAGLAAAGQFAKIAVPFSQMRAVYPDVGAEFGWLLSLVSLVGALLGVVGGGLVSRWGAKRVLLMGLCIGAVVSLHQASIPDFSFMLVSRLGEGIAHLAIVVAAPTLIGQIASDRFRGSAMTLWSTFFGVSFALFAVFGLEVVETYGIAGLFLGHAGILAVLAVLIALFVQPVAKAAISHTPWIAQHRRAYSSASIGAPGSGWLFYTLTFVALLAILPEMLSTAQVAITLTLMSLVSIIVSLTVVSALLRFFSSVTIIVAGFVLASVVVLFGFQSDNQAFWAIVLFGVLGLVQGASFSAVPELNSTFEDQALAYGLMAQMGNIGNLFGTPLLLMVLTVGGRTALVAVLIVIYVLAAANHIWLTARRRALATQ